jgi:hypothetical protein
MLGSLLGRALAMAGKTIVAAAVSTAATELQRPENQRRLAEGAQRVAGQLRDPQIAERVDQTIASGARTLGRAFGNWRNRE